MSPRRDPRHWLEANDGVSLFGDRAIMTQDVMDGIAVYQFSAPTSPSPGRMYLREYADGWWLHVVQTGPTWDGEPVNVHKPYRVLIEAAACSTPTTEKQ